MYCSAEAFKRGIPAMDIECGRLGIIEPLLVDKIVSGMKSLLKHLNMEEGKAIYTKEILYISQRVSLSSEDTGIFYGLKSGGDHVKKDMQIGYITDFFGTKIKDVHAPASGVILYILGTPPVNKGETLVSIGEVGE